MKQYLRYYTLQIGDDKESVEISNLRVKFSIRHTHDKTPNKATISVYNLNPTHRNLVVNKQYSKVSLSVGYGTPENCRLLYSGQISKPRTLREGVDYITEMECDDGATDYRNAFMSVTLAAGSTHSDVLEQCIKTMKDIQPGVVGVDGSVTLSRGRVCYGMTRDVLTQVAGHHDADWSVQNGRLIILKADYCQPGEGTMLSQETGMINSPRVTNDGLEVSCLLNPSIQVGGLIRIDSIVDDYDGDYKVTSIESTGDSHDNEWTSKITAVNGKFKKAKKMKKKGRKNAVSS
ncbi:phage protein [Lelliottia wanjuensis]|uniref:phage protein n=1 Tax=Lelliottia wanjuensis TaxID=3050585 RepID=UPI00254F4EE2|nr:hypothetical protein [Lelliottia sp. V104_15]MDK9607117.1 hypothetical protein [Lelliottia sp. V104_15]